MEWFVNELFKVWDDGVGIVIEVIEEDGILFWSSETKEFVVTAEVNEEGIVGTVEAAIVVELLLLWVVVVIEVVTFVDVVVVVVAPDITLVWKWFEFGIILFAICMGEGFVIIEGEDCLTDFLIELVLFFDWFFTIPVDIGILACALDGGDFWLIFFCFVNWDCNWVWVSCNPKEDFGLFNGERVEIWEVNAACVVTEDGIVVDKGNDFAIASNVAVADTVADVNTNPDAVVVNNELALAGTFNILPFGIL